MHRPGVVIHLVKQPVFAAIELLEMGIGRLEAFELSRNRVERANRTFREEFYDCSTATPTVAGFRADLLAGNTPTTTSTPTKHSATSRPLSFSLPATPPTPRRKCHGRLEPVQALAGEYGDTLCSPHSS